MTGLVPAFLTAAGITLVLLGTAAGLAVADFPVAVAVAAGLGVSGACLYLCYRWRFRHGGPWFPPLAELWFLAAGLWWERRAARPRWTPGERAVLKGKLGAGELFDALPGARRGEKPR